jgi:3,4-dihydroxy 2-butanone 4-phosphate synthase/GTP cyclohydrolase II
MLGIETYLQGAEAHRRRLGRPLVSLCYAQSLDGSLTAQPGQRTALSGPESSRLTHWLRSAHDAILVGVGTVLSDDPLLTVRLTQGENPQPVILDSRLRTPVQANLMRQHPRPPWIATTTHADPEKGAALEARGARLLRLPPDSTGRVPLPALLECLGGSGVNSVMVEGGAQIITAFLASRLVDLVVLTIVPIFLGGLPAISADDPSTRSTFGPLRLGNPTYERLGDDLIVWGSLS